MEENTLKKIDDVIITLCDEIKTSRTDQIIALAEALGTILTARAILNTD